jgi:hypothetical protein
MPDDTRRDGDTALDELALNQAAVVFSIKFAEGDWWAADRWADVVLAQNDEDAVPPAESR